MIRFFSVLGVGALFALSCSSESTNVSSGGSAGAGGSDGGGSGGSGGSGGVGGGTGGDASVSPSCTDQTKNGDETDKDCGGSCPACDNGKGCKSGADCASKVCDANQSICNPPDCTDGQTNGQETAADCGGSACPKCADGKACAQHSDCTSGVCSGNICQAPSCGDGVKNGTETGVDCGASCTSSEGKKCKDGEGCSDASECVSGICIGSPTKTCAAPTCTDTVKNGAETDLNCGGGSCPKCDDGKKCGTGGDCTSGVCTSTTCQVPSCTDNVKNGSEPDVDCGSSCTTKCADGKACGAGTDCASGVCAGNVCLVPTCADGVKNGSEGDVDCGGSCKACKAGAGCSVHADCSTGLCSMSKCARWSKDFATVNWEVPLGFAIGPSGRTVIAGRHNLDDLDLGGVKLAAGQNFNGFVAVHDSTGAHVWSKSLGIKDTWYESVMAVAMDSASNVHAFIAYTSQLDLGTAACPALSVSTGNTYALAVAKLAAADGACLSVTSLVQSGGVPEVGDIAVNAAGHVAVTGAVTDGTDTDVLVARIDAGVVSWQKTFTGPNVDGGLGDDVGLGVGLNAAGDVFVTGTFRSSIDLTSPALPAAGTNGLFVARLAAANGSTTWAKAWGCTNPALGYGTNRGEALAVDAIGDVLVAGALIPPGCELGSGTFAGPGASDAFVAKYKGSDGSQLWQKFAGSVDADAVTALAVDAAGNVAFGGVTQGTSMSFGEAVGAGGYMDGFVVLLDPAGAHVDSLTLSGASEERVVGLGFNPKGGLVGYGVHGANANVGFTPLLAGSANYDLFLVSWGASLP